MTDSVNASIPAGWYPDPAGSASRRWWDGGQWTDRLETPYSPQATAAALRAPDGTRTDTLWIWLLVLIPILQTLPLFFIDWSVYMSGMLDPEVLTSPDPDAAIAASMLAPFAIFTDPAYIATMVIGVVGTAVLIVAAWLDQRELSARGVPQPFPWPWIFLTLVVTSAVYTIGRSVVVKRRTGQGAWPMWAAITTLVLQVVVAPIVIVIVVFASMAELLTQLPY